MDSFKKLISERLNTPTEYTNFIDKIAETQRDSSLVCFLGAGTSISQGYKDWNGYVNDLIQYWKSHLGDLISEKTFYSQVRAEDINFLDWLAIKSNYDNKRKIDMVHHIIKNYCKSKTNVLADQENRYAEHENDFEKYNFLEIMPIKQNNEIIDQILNLSGFFITSNYDDQIEKSYNRVLKVTPRILNDVSELTDNEKLPDKSILHLHGKPSKPGVLLVSSSNSYIRLYFNNNKFKSKLIKQLELQGSKVLLFIGSSLEEDEILNLFTFSSPSLKKFALMKYRSDFTFEQANKIKEYYRDEKGINIIWYGKDYGDLPQFLKEMKKDIDKKNDKESTFISPDIIKEDLKSQDYVALKEDITKAINNNEEFDESFKDNLDPKSIELLVNIPSFFNKISKSNIDVYFWREVKKYFHHLSQSIQNKIIDIIQQMSITYKYHEAVDILDIYSKKLSPAKRFDFLYENSKKFLSGDVSPDLLSTNDEKVIWLLINLSSQLNYSLGGILNLENNKSIEFKLSSSALKKLLSIIEKDSYMATAKFEDILEENRWKDLYALLAANRIRYKGVFPKYFYKNKLVQRLLVNLALEDKLPKSSFSIEKLIQSINFDDKLLGQEMNNFVSQYVNHVSQTKPKNYYIDGWWTSSAELTENKPFFYVVPPNNDAEVKTLVRKLKDTLKSKSTVMHDENIFGQHENLEKTLNNDKAWQNFAKYNIQFLNELMKDNQLFREYLVEINKMLIKGVQLEYITQEMLSKYLNQLSVNLDIAFQASYCDLLEFIAESGTNQQKKLLYSFMFNQVDLSKISFYSQNLNINKKWISLTDYINSSTYTFLKLIEILIEKDNRWFSTEYRAKLLGEINSLDKEERCFLKGWYYNWFKDDGELSTIYAFIGFSYRYRIGKEVYQIFRKPVIELLNTDFKDRNCMFNFAQMLAFALLPENINFDIPIKAENYKRSLINTMVQAYLKNGLDSNSNILEWINWATKIIRKFPQDLLDLIVRYVDNFNKGNLLFEYLVNNRSHIPNYSLVFPFISFKKDVKYEKESFKLLIKIIDTLFNNHSLKIDFNLYLSLDTILKELKENKFYDLISNILSISKQFLPSTEWKNLKDKY